MGVPLSLATATSVSLSVRQSVHIKLLDVELVLSSPRYNDGIMVAFTGDIFNREFSFARQVAL